MHKMFILFIFFYAILYVTVVAKQVWNGMHKHSVTDVAQLPVFVLLPLSMAGEFPMQKFPVW
jgi:hypothetical protein